MFTETNRDKFISILLSSTLDNFGFRRNAVAVRAKTFEVLSEMGSAASSKIGLPLVIICAGSAGEGTNLKGSDLDSMIIYSDTVCVDRAAFSRYLDILETDYMDTPPGYTRIKSVHLCTITDSFLSLSEMYQSSSGYPYISSAVYRNMDFQVLCELHHARYDKFRFAESITTNGPACTSKIITSESETLEHDAVYAIYYYGKYISQRIKKARFNNWPPESVVKEISEMEGFVVPVGMKESENVNIEWRVCYTTAEMKLVGSLNDIQMKLCILLKIMAKHIKRVCKPITSYLVKNIVFWVAEGSAQSQFSPDLLVFLVKKLLCFTKHCLLNNYLPNYMIPERNMLTGAFSRQDKWILEKLVSEYLETDSLTCILRTNFKIKMCVSYLYTCPNFVHLYGQWRDEVEKLLALNNQQRFEYLDVRMLARKTFLSDLEDKYSRDNRCISSWMKILLLLVPNWWLLFTSGKSDEVLELYRQRIQFLDML